MAKTIDKLDKSVQQTLDMSGYATTNHGTHVTFTSTVPKVAGTAAVGSATTVSRSDHVHPSQTSVSGNAGTATKLATARTITLTGSVTGSVSFDGSQNVSMTTTTNHGHSHINRTMITTPIYNPGTGVLVDFNLNVKSGVMAIIKLYGNSYSSNPPIEAIYQFYDYASGDIQQCTGSAISGPPITLKVYKADGKLKAWFQQPNNYCTFKLEVAYGNNSSTPNVTLSNAAAPTTNITQTVTITPNRVYSAAYKPTPSDIGAAASSHGTHVTYSSTAPKVAGTAAVGSENAVARGDHVHAAQTSVSGNAGTATKLATARNIVIGNKTNSFNGTANITFTLADIGAAASGHTHNYAGSGSAGGAANSATKLATARTITIGNKANTFDGSGNITYTLSDIGAAAASHGTHLTIGTGASNAAAGNHTHSYLPLSGGTLSGRLTADGKITLPTSGSSWVKGMTPSNASIEIKTQQTSDSYHPILAVKTAGNHVANIGGLNNDFGFYGFKSGRTENATDWSFKVDASSGNWTMTGSLTSGGSIVPSTAFTPSLGSAAKPWNTAYADHFQIYGEASKQYGFLGAVTTGTTSATGEARLTLGNSTATGTASNSYGRILMYGTSSGYSILTPGNNTTSNITITLPSSGGTLARTADNVASATKLATARNIKLGGLLSGSASFNGTADATISASIAAPPKSGDWFSGGIPTVSTGGVMEIGKYIDFHNTDASTNDYDVRLQCNTSTPCVITLPTSTSTLATTAQTGTLSSLKTKAKDNLVAAINELFQSAANAKDRLIEALAAQGVVNSTSDSFEAILNNLLPLVGAAKPVTGRITWNYEGRVLTDRVFTIDDIGFTPTSMFVVLDNVYCTRTVAANVMISNYTQTTINEDEEYYVTLQVTNMTSTSFTIDFVKNYASAHSLRDGLTWYAFK